MARMPQVRRLRLQLPALPSACIALQQDLPDREGSPM